MNNYSVGDGVTAVSGPMKGVYGTVIWFYEEKNQILVRFGGSQQLYFTADELVRWGT